MIKKVPGMGNETSLHSAIKYWYSLPGDRFESKVNDFVVDIARDDLLVEIQTKNFSATREKLGSLARNHRVRLVYPIAKEKWIAHVDPLTGRLIRRRRSPRRGTVLDLFAELMWIPEITRERNFSIEVLMIEEEETRCADGKGSWRRRGISIRDRELIEVVDRLVFACKEDYLNLLPEDLAQPFTNKTLAESMNIPVTHVRRMTYCLRKMGAISEVGKRKRESLFAFSECGQQQDPARGHQ